jgi:hypothetical protein
MSPRLEHLLEKLNFDIKMSQFAPENHLKEREKQYIQSPDMGGDIFIVRETEQGWWRETHDYEKDVEAQIKRYQEDKTVAMGWFGTPRFKGNGGWS